MNAQEGQPVLDGQFKMEMAKGKLDEMTMTYARNKPLVFAAHLEKVEYDKDNGNIAGMKPASQVNQLLAPGDRICS
ncbi:MAG: hypothetical protein WBY71_05985 [Nitrososphaeraceae archaeon]